MTGKTFFAHPKLLRTLLCGYCLIWVAIFATKSAHWQQVNDPAQIHYAVFLMDHGMSPYRDILEFNMPGIYLANWTVMHTLGGGSVAWRIFDFGLAGVAAWAMIAIAQPYDWLGGALGAAMFVLFHGKDGAGQEGQRDLIIAVLLLCACWFLFQAFRKGKPALVFLVALFGSAATTIKPFPLVFVLVLLWAAAARWRREGTPLAKPLLMALAGLLIPLAVVGGFLLQKHSLSAFWYLLRVEMPFYANVGRMAWPRLLTMMASTSIVALIVLGFTVARMERDWGNWEQKVLLAGVLFGAISFVVQGKGLPYHRYPMLAFLFLWLGMQFVAALKGGGKAACVAVAGVVLMLVLMPIYVRIASHKEWATQYSDALTQDLNRLGGAQLSGHVQCIDLPADCHATLYKLQLVQSTGLFYDFLIFGSDGERVIRDARAHFWQQFEQNTPHVIVVGRGLYPYHDGYEKLSNWPLFQQTLEAKYVLYADRSFPYAEAGQRAYRIYVERGMAEPVRR